MAEPRTAAISEEALAQGHQPDDPSVRGIGFFVILLVALIVGAILGMYWLLSILAAGRTPAEVSPLQAEAQRPPTAGGLLPFDQRNELLQLRQAEHRQLTTYGWIDQDGGIARIPIDRAMEILAEQGLPQPDASQNDQPAVETGTTQPPAEESETSPPAAEGNAEQEAAGQEEIP
ncbi:MAG: hypothetical protein WDZ59_11910 [Pirellulales bacterium]